MKTIQIDKCPKCNNKNLINNSKRFYLCKCGHIFKKEREISDKDIKDLINQYLRDNKVPDNYDKKMIPAMIYAYNLGRDERIYVEQNCL